MKTKLAGILLLAALAAAPQAAPISFNEVSLLVRMHEKETYIAQQLSQRHLLRALTPGQAAKLKEQGAPESLLQTLQNPATVLAPAAATAFESWTAEQRKITAEKVAQLNADLAATEAARISAAASWSEPQNRTPAPAEASADEALPPLSDYAPYGYGSYGNGAYGGRGRGAGLPWTNRSANRSSGVGSLQWNNGTATTHTGAGITYYPLGSNGAGKPAGASAPAPHASVAHTTAAHVSGNQSPATNSGHTDSGHSGSGRSGR